jgi:hypothetical protein
MISTRDLSQLPNVDDLRGLLRSLAMLDAILSPEWVYRYYSFNSAWADGEEMGSMRDGSGDHFFAHFSRAGCWLKGFVHESAISPFGDGRTDGVWPGVLDNVPKEFAACLQEPAFSIDEVTFCIWIRPDDIRWRVGPIQLPANIPDPDGSESLLSILDGRPESYQAWATEYFEREVPLAPVRQIYGGVSLSNEIVSQLNPQLSLADLISDMKEIGYPGVGLRR